MDAKRGLFGSLKRVSTNLGGTGDKDDEKADIDAMTRSVAIRISGGR